MVLRPLTVGCRPAPAEGGSLGLSSRTRPAEGHPQTALHRPSVSSRCPPNSCTDKTPGLEAESFTATAGWAIRTRARPQVTEPGRAPQNVARAPRRRERITHEKPQYRKRKARKTYALDMTYNRR